MIQRNLIREIDWVLIGLLLLTSAVGCLLIYSSSSHLSADYTVKQVFWVFVGTALLFSVLLIDYKLLVGYSPYLYAFFIIVLTALLIFGREIAGTKSWFRLAFIGIQPSEIMKVVLILLLAFVFTEYKRSSLTVWAGLMGGGIVALPLLLVALQPDLGTAVSYLAVLLAALLLAGLSKKALAVFLIIGLLLGMAAWNFYLKDYQKMRISTLLFPGQDPQGAGYQIQQSRIAIGSGGLLGKGFRQGTQSQLNFLPARHTDFIVSVLGEEFGFFGFLAVMALYFFLLRRLFRSVERSRDRTGIYVVFMVAFLMAYQFSVNALMVVGLFPVAGVPMPLLSYGGSSLVNTFLGIGLVLNVRMRRFANV